MIVMAEAASKKEEGNQHFKEGRISEALACYTKALSLNPHGGQDTATYLKNRAACYLKLDKFTETVADCTAALELLPSDPKALFRRCQAWEQLGNVEEAYKDVMSILKVDPKNAAIQPILKRINPIIQDKMRKQTSTEGKVSQMFDLAFKNISGDEEKRQQAAQNLIVLAREESGARKIFNSGGVKNLNFLLDTEKDKNLKLTAIRVLACLSKDNRERATSILEEVTVKKICAYTAVEDEDLSTATAHALQSIINSVTGLEGFKKEREKHEAERKADPGSRMRPYPFLAEKIDEEARTIIDGIFIGLVPMLNNSKVSGFGRDNVIELMIKFITRKDGVGWPLKFIECGGIQNLLEAAGTIPEHHIIPITQNTRMHCSLLLSKIYEDLLSDKERDLYREAVDAYFKDLFQDTILDSKIEAVLALGALLQGPLEVGNGILGREGVLELILALVDSGNAVHTKYAIEALVHSSSKKDKVNAVIKQATPILKELYQSQNDSIKVRALVGLCKLGSFGGSDASAKSFAEGSTQTLAKACRKFLCNPAKDVDLRKWAAEGLAYLSLDAEVKEDLVEDVQSLLSLIDLAKVPDKGTVYPVSQILVNVTNSYDVEKPEPEMLELAKFAKHHIPEDHEKDSEEHIKKRVDKLVKAGVVNALVALSKTESESSKELLARVFLAIATEKEHRGLVVQQGGAKALIPLCLEGTEKGKIKAAHALAKVAITINPEIAFPGDRACDIVRPLVKHLLHMQRTALENFEALLALTNLASMNDRVRGRMLKEETMVNVEHYMFEAHEHLRRAATECLCNMLRCKEVQKMFKGDNDRVKLLVLFCGEEDISLVRAAAGALAMLTGEADKEICNKVVKSSESWFEIMQILAAHELPDIQHRGAYILKNLMAADKEIAQRIVESNMLEILMALSKLTEPERQSAKECADEALQTAVKYELIKPLAETKS